jgi:hypothetical protein
MKKIILIILCYCSINSYAQKSQNVDSVYYLLDTIKTPAKDRIWEIHLEYPSLKIYTIQCSCLAYDSSPAFVYRSNEQQTLAKKDIKNFKLISLVKLIGLTKLITTKMLDHKVVFFIIEPHGQNYTLSRVHLLKPSKPRGPSIDYENIPSPDTVKH